MDNAALINEMQDQAESLRAKLYLFQESAVNGDEGNVENIAGAEQALDNLDSFLDSLVP